MSDEKAPQVPEAKTQDPSTDVVASVTTYIDRAIAAWRGQR